MEDSWNKIELFIDEVKSNCYYVISTSTISVKLNYISIHVKRAQTLYL